MIQNVDIEHYFRDNIDKIKKRKFMSVVAWKSGSLVNCMGKTETFEKGKSEIVRRGEYDYVVICTDKENDVMGEDAIVATVPLKEVRKSKRNAAGLKKESFRTIVQEKIINQ